MTTRVSPSAVNFRTPSGAWRAIDNTLVPVAGGFRNAANAFGVRLPQSSGAAVSVSRGGASVSWRLLGAQGSGSARGDTETFAGALAQTDLLYTAQADSVKEGLRINGPGGPSRFSFAVSASAGVSARRRRDGSVVFGDRSGRRVFEFAAASMVSADHAGRVPVVVPSALRSTAGGWVLTLSPPRRALAGLLARGPVVIDPTLHVASTTQDCTIESAYSQSCNPPSGVDEVGVKSAGDEVRSLLSFNVTASLPQDAIVLNAKLGVYLRSTSTSSLNNVEVHQLTHAWSYGTNWATYDGTHSWTTAGGDFNATVEDQHLVGYQTGWQYFYPTQLVQKWVDGSADGGTPGSAQTAGLMLKAQSNPAVNWMQFSSSRATDGTPALPRCVLGAAHGL